MVTVNKYHHSSRIYTCQLYMVRWSPLGASSGDEYPTPPQAKSISWTLPGGEYTPPGYSALGTYPRYPLWVLTPPLDIPTHPQKGPGTMVTHLPRRDLEPWLLTPPQKGPVTRDTPPPIDRHTPVKTLPSSNIVGGQ